ncbi:MAG: bacteriohemerythrin [Betaproteobacteria bacterium]|nr:bacteriohemerythrin [Betaproteobacteria bacterium]
MAHLIWNNTLNTGIDVIDGQHRRIVEFINQLDDARLTGNRAAMGEVIDGMVDYTLSHFVFEECLMEDAGYEFLRAHKKVHEIFIRRVAEMQTQFRAGQDVSLELHNLLSRWLFNHIRNDDAVYVGAVKAKMTDLVQEKGQDGWLTRSLARFFRSA